MDRDSMATCAPSGTGVKRRKGVQAISDDVVLFVTFHLGMPRMHARALAARMVRLNVCSGAWGAVMQLAMVRNKQVVSARLLEV